MVGVDVMVGVKVIVGVNVAPTVRVIVASGVEVKAGVSVWVGGMGVGVITCIGNLHASRAKTETRTAKCFLLI